MSFLTNWWYGGLINKNYKLTDQDVFDYVKETSTFSQTTKNIYLNKLSIVKSEFFDQPKTFLWILEHPDEFKEALISYGEKHNYSPSTLTHFCAIMISIITHHLDLQEIYPNMLKQWRAIKAEVEEPVTKKYDSNKPTNKQHKGFIPYDELIKIKNELPKGSSSRLLISMYTLIPPQRMNFDSVKIYKDDPNNKENNYIVFDDQPRLIMNHYKTSRKYDTITINLPDELQKEIIYSLDKNPREYLFVGRDNQPYRKNGTYSSWANATLKRVLKNPDFTPTMFRHIYISRPDLDVNNLTLGEKKKLAKSMGHSTQMQNQYLFKE